MASSAPVQIDRQLIAELTDKEEKRLEDVDTQVVRAV